MDIIFMTSKNIRTSEYHVLVLKLADKLDLKRGQKSVVLSNLSIYYTWKNIKSSYNNNNNTFKTYLSNFWRTLEMPLFNCEISIILTWSPKCVTVSNNVANQNGTLAIIDTKLYVPVVTLSTQDNAKLLQQLQSGFKIVINWNKYLSKSELLAQNSSLNYLVKRSFQRVNRLFVLAFENNTQRASAKGYYLPNVEIKNYSIMINGENFFDQPIKNNKVTYENIGKIATGEGDD